MPSQILRSERGSGKWKIRWLGLESGFMILKHTNHTIEGKLRDENEGKFQREMCLLPPSGSYVCSYIGKLKIDTQFNWKKIVPLASRTRNTYLRKLRGNFHGIRETHPFQFCFPISVFLIFQNSNKAKSVLIKWKNWTH